MTEKALEGKYSNLLNAQVRPPLPCSSLESLLMRIALLRTCSKAGAPPTVSSFRELLTADLLVLQPAQDSDRARQLGDYAAQ